MSSFSILIFIYRPRARVSFLVVSDVIEKGLKPVDESSCDGKRFTANVTLAVPSNDLKSGIKRRTDKNLSPSVPCPSKSKSYDFTKELIAVLDPSVLI